MASTTWLATFLEATAGPHTTATRMTLCFTYCIADAHKLCSPLHSLCIELHLLLSFCAFQHGRCTLWVNTLPQVSLQLHPSSLVDAAVNCADGMLLQCCVAVITLLTCLDMCRSTKMEMTTPAISTGGQQGPSGDKMQFPIESKYGEDPDVLPLPNDARQDLVSSNKLLCIAHQGNKSLCIAHQEQAETQNEHT